MTIAQQSVGPAGQPTSGPYVAQESDHQRLEWIGDNVMEILLGAEQTGGQLALFRNRAGAGSAVPVHVHDLEDEILLVLAGRATVWVGDERHEVGEGGVAFLPRGVPHAYRVTSETADLLGICTPAGFEGFLRTVGRDLSQPRPAGWAIAPAAMGAAMARYGGRVVGPPKTAAD